MAIITEKKTVATVGELIEVLRRYPKDMSIESGREEAITVGLVQPQPLEKLEDQRGYVVIGVADDAVLDDEEW